MAGERNRLLADAFHQVAVGGEHEGRMIDHVVAELGCEMPLGNRHADGIAEALAERAGGGLNASGDEILWMAGVSIEPSWRNFLIWSSDTDS